MGSLKKKGIIIAIVVLVCFIIGAFAFTTIGSSSQVKEQLKLANKYLDEGKYKEAILAFNKVISIEAKNIEARIGISKAYVGLGKYEEAEKVLKDAVDIDPKKPEPYLELAKLFIKQNKYEDAITILQKGYDQTKDNSIKQMLDELTSISIKNVSLKLNNPVKNSVITIEGTGFGRQSPYNGNSQYLELADMTSNWSAGSLADNDAVTLDVVQWENNKIVINGFTGEYGKYTWNIAPGDLIKITVWKPQGTSSQSATYDLKISLTTGNDDNLSPKLSQTGKIIDGKIMHSCTPDRLAVASSKILTVTYPSDAVKREYKLGNDEWLPYIGPITITSNIYVYTRAFNAEGNTYTGGIEITNMKKN